MIVEGRIIRTKFVELSQCEEMTIKTINKEQRLIEGRLYDITKKNVTVSRKKDLTKPLTPENRKEEVEEIEIKKINIDSTQWFRIKDYDLKNIQRLDVRAMLEIRLNIKYNLENGQTKYAKEHFIADCADLSEYLYGGTAYSIKSIFDLSPISGDIPFYDMFLDLNDPSNGYPEHEIKETLDEFTSSAVCVNLDLSDDVIIEGFKEWLKNKRGNQSARNTRKLTELELLKVINYKVMAHIDLILWQMITGNKLTQKEIIERLYPNDRDKDADFLRKTLTPLTERLLYSDTNLI